MLRIGDVTLKTNLLLAPIAGYCDLPFRLTVRSVSESAPGIGTLGLASTDLLCPEAILHERDKTMWLAATCPEDQPLAMQLYGADAYVMAEAARWAATPREAGGGGATLIDINMGCPVDKITKRNGGSRLLCDPADTVRLARGVVDAAAELGKHVTAKIRLGWDDARIITQTLPAALADVGIAAVTVHGRTTEQKFRGAARWTTGGLDCIRAVVESMAKRHPDVPVIGNGDVKAPEDARRMIEMTGCAGVMIGRGALGQPWLFRDTAHLLATGELPEPLSQAERAAVVLGHVERLVTMRDERYTLNTMRGRMSWYSPHLQPWPGLKREVQPMQSVAELTDYLANGIERLRRGLEPVERTMRAAA